MTMPQALFGAVTALGLVILYQLYRSTRSPRPRPDNAEEVPKARGVSLDARRTSGELTLINQASDATRGDKNSEVTIGYAAYREGLAMGRDTHEKNVTMVHEAYREGVAKGCEVFEKGVAMGFAKANETISAVTSSTSSRLKGSSGDVRLSTSNSRTSLRPGRDGSGRITHRRRTGSRSDSRRRGDDSSYGSDDNLPRGSDDSGVVNDRRYDISSEDTDGTCGTGYSELRARERRHNRI